MVVWGSNFRPLEDSGLYLVTSLSKVIQLLDCKDLKLVNMLSFLFRRNWSKIHAFHLNQFAFQNLSALSSIGLRFADMPCKIAFTWAFWRKKGPLVVCWVFFFGMKIYPVTWGLLSKPWHKDPGTLNNQDDSWKVRDPGLFDRGSINKHTHCLEQRPE